MRPLRAGHLLTDATVGPSVAAGARDARRVGVNVLGLVAQAALPAFHVQLARYLGAGGYGLYTWAAAFVDLFSIVTLLGCDQAIVRRVSMDGRAATVAVGSALRVVLVSGALVAAALIFGAPTVAAVQGKPGLIGPLRCLALMPVLYHASTVLLSATQALGVMRWAFWARSVAQPLVLLATTSAALRLGWGPSGAALAVVSGMGVTALLSAVLYAREMSLGATLRAMLTAPLDREMVRVALPLVGANLLWALLARVDALVLGHYGDARELGAYAACGLYAASISQIRGAFEPVTSALVAPALARGDAAGLSRAIQRQTRWLAYAAFPLAALFITLGAPLLEVFGHGFTRGTAALAMLSVGHVANALALASFALSLGGRPHLTTLVAGGTLVIQTALLLWLVPRYGTLGAALALAAGLVLAQGAQLFLANGILGVRGLSLGLVPLAASAVVAGGVGRLVYTSFGGSVVVRFASGTLLAAVVYAALALAVAVPRDDRALAMRLLGIRDNGP